MYHTRTFMFGVDILCGIGLLTFLPGWILVNGLVVIRILSRRIMERPLALFVAVSCALKSIVSK